MHHPGAHAPQCCDYLSASTVEIAIPCLMTLSIGDVTLKAKVPAEIGRALGGQAWMQLPLERITLFGADGHKPDIVLQRAPA